ncbi:hypothetical protein H7K45_17410 [Mycobacterium yunnanensis]|uniref:Integral membrane protein n=1 Tax=Mycobacterium yunnanensis TaxID=368477 RepID=A0A9X2Z2E6_9MYCO|nr:hypothetical protein [Mycobacterium yunnanensis]MCV7422328.1 hypothetical protein [Mycobacterium yunnanensis]
MQALLLSVHVVFAILFVGPPAVAVSIFPRFVPAAAGVGSRPERAGERNLAVARVLHRLTRVYGLLALAVPVLGIALAIVQHRMTEVWVLVAMVLTAAAGALLALRIVPAQRHVLARNATRAELSRMGMLGGIFNLLWVVVVVLMIVRPGAMTP